LIKVIVIPKIINHQITQHFFFFAKRKPVLKEKQISLVKLSF